MSGTSNYNDYDTSTNMSWTSNDVEVVDLNNSIGLSGNVVKICRVPYEVLDVNQLGGPSNDVEV
ncbi:hypothetical protein GIB67_024706, partial [Kingdonia uniflora]